MGSPLIFLILINLCMQGGTTFASDTKSLETLTTQDSLIQSVEKFEDVKVAISEMDAPACAPDSICSWIDTVPKLKAKQKIEAAEVMFVTHASTFFNRNLSIKDALNRHIAEAKERGAVVIYLMDNLHKRFISQYFLAQPPSYVARSEGGDHEFNIRAKNLIFTGGYFEACSAETVRDALLFSDPDATLHLTFLTDSLFIRDNGKGGTPLKTALTGKKNEEILKFLKETYFEKDELGDQNWHKERAATFKDFTFKIFRDGQEIGQFGQGARPVELNFVIESNK